MGRRGGEGDEGGVRSESAGAEGFEDDGRGQISQVRISFTPNNKMVILISIQRRSRRPCASDPLPNNHVSLALVQNHVEQQRVPFARPDASHQPDPAEHVAEQAIGRYRKCAIEARYVYRDREGG